MTDQETSLDLLRRCNPAINRSEVRVTTHGEPDRTLVRLEPPGGAVVHGWAHSGDAIVYGRTNGPRQSVWKVSTVSGESIDLRFRAPTTPNPFRLDP
jgi:hypothetical protein